MEAQRHRMEERRLDIVVNGGTEAYIVWWTAYGGTEAPYGGAEVRHRN